jgi:hypothetical protein
MVFSAPRGLEICESDDPGNRNILNLFRTNSVCNPGEPPVVNEGFRSLITHAQPFFERMNFSIMTGAVTLICF